MAKKFKTKAALFSSLGLLLAFILMAGFVPQTSAETISLTYGTYFPETHFFTKADKAFMEKVQKETNGQVEFKIFAGGTLISRQEGLAELKNRVADLAYVTTDYAPGFQVLKTQRSFYYGAADLGVCRKIYHEIAAKYPQLEGEFEGVKVMARVNIPPYQILTVKKPIRTVEDLKGLKLKAATPLIPALRALGAEGLNIPLSETYVALEKGIIDGCLLPLDVFKSFALSEVIKYCTRLDYYMGPYPSRAFNIKAFDSLPKDVQKAFENNIDFWGEEVERLGMAAVQTGMDAANKANVQFLEFEPGELDKFYDALSEEAMKEAKKLDDMGLPGTAVFKEVRALIKKYPK